MCEARNRTGPGLSHNENPENNMTTTETTGSLTVPDIDELREEIDRLDAAILEAVQRRTEVSQLIGKARMASGGTRLVHSREMKVIERYSVLGDEGKNLAMLLLRLGRGRLGK
ncbi:chorismate mutase [Mycolicibacterium austroafricanum]|uniref:chorismate mutase n=1 Tax=Mycolicibacterium austroafricanum TaxID=39687 RepID=UPI0022A85C14|nr:chorismate mutase [Mycolicibacterium austroafricanum]